MEPNEIIRLIREGQSWEDIKRISPTVTDEQIREALRRELEEQSEVAEGIQSLLEATQGEPDDKPLTLQLENQAVGSFTRRDLKKRLESAGVSLATLEVQLAQVRTLLEESLLLLNKIESTLSSESNEA